MIFAVPESKCRRQNEVEKQKIRTALMPEGDMCLSPPWTWLVTPSCTKPGWTAEEFTLCRKVSWAAFLGQSSVSRTNLAEEKLCCFWQVSTHLCWRRQQIILGAVVSPEPLCYFRSEHLISDFQLPHMPWRTPTFFCHSRLLHPNHSSSFCIRY